MGDESEAIDFTGNDERCFWLALTTERKVGLTSSSTDRVRAVMPLIPPHGREEVPEA